MSTVIVGRKPVLEALKAGASVEKIVLLVGIHGTPIDDIRALAHQNRVPIHEADRNKFRDIVDDQQTQGVIAFLSDKFKYLQLEHVLSIPAERSEVPFLLLLDEIEDPHNLGALIRTAECAGVHGIIVPKHRSAPVNATVVKSSAGATAHVAICEVTNMVNTIKELKEHNVWIVGLDGEAEKGFTDIDYASPIALVVGNEGKGIRRLVKEHCDFLVKIPLRGKIESLNASVAGAVAMFEVVRQRMKSLA